jgi:Ribbon-helix-helix protein, copG family
VAGAKNKSRARKPPEGMSRVVINVPTEYRELLDEHRRETGVPMTRVLRDLLRDWAGRREATINGRRGASGRRCIQT